MTQIPLFTLLWISSGSLVLLTALNGCATRGTAIPEGGPTMAQIYEQAMQQSGGNSLATIRGMTKDISVHDEGTNQRLDYTRTAGNEINNLFPLLPNPPIVMYIAPHLGGIDAAPIPGYTTAFPFYTEEHYALPGEVPLLATASS